MTSQPIIVCEKCKSFNVTLLPKEEHWLQWLKAELTFNLKLTDQSGVYRCKACGIPLKLEMPLNTVRPIPLMRQDVSIAIRTL